MYYGKLMDEKIGKIDRKNDIIRFKQINIIL